MPSIPLTEVYARIEHRRTNELESARSNGLDHINYSFSDFQKDVMSDSFILTESTTKAKWTAAIADEVIIPVGMKKYGKAVLDIFALYAKTGKKYTHTYTHIHERGFKYNPETAVKEVSQ